MTTIETKPEVQSVPIPQDRRAHLRIKVKSLALEAVAIRQDERRHLAKARRSPDPAHKSYHQQAHVGLQGHRTGVVRAEARHSQLAYAFLLGRPYKSCEAKVREGNAPLAKNVSAIAHRFSANWWNAKASDEVTKAVTSWLSA